MMREFKKYDEYKESGIEWMDNIPKNWDILENKYIFRYRKNYKNREEDTPVLSLTINGVKLKKELSFGKSTESYIGHQLVYPGELVFTPRDFDQTPILSGVSKDYGCISNLYFVLDSNERAINEYINYYWWGLKYGYDYFRNFSTGLRYSFNRAEFDRIPFICPSIKEQQKIASFLDQKTAEIDEIITKKEKLIDHLEKYKKSVITEAVTKGKLGDKYINEDGELVDEIEMKDSGVEWIGEIPEYWEVSKIKYLLLDGNDGIRIGPFGSSLKLEEMNPNFPYKVYGQKHVINNNFRIGTRYINETKFKEMKRYEIFPEDILVTMMGTIGKCKVIPKEIKRGIIDSHLIRIRVNESKILADFLALTIEKNHYTYEAMNYLSNGTVMSGLNSTIIKDLTVVLPSIENQNIIINYLSEKTEEIDNLIEKTKESIEKYKEYKKSMIFEAVTGKIDLRDYELEGGKEIVEHNNSREAERKELSEVN